MGYSRKVAKSKVIKSIFPSFEFTSISAGLDATIEYFLSVVNKFDGKPSIT